MNETFNEGRKKKKTISVMEHPEKLMVKLAPDMPDVMGSALYCAQAENAHPPDGTNSVDLLDWCAEHQL